MNKGLALVRYTTLLLLIIILIFIMPMTIRGGLAGITSIGGLIFSLLLVGIFLITATAVRNKQNAKKQVSNFGLILGFVSFGWLSFSVLINPDPFGPWGYDHYSVMGGGHEVDIATRQSVFMLSALVNIGLAFAALHLKDHWHNTKAWGFTLLSCCHLLFVVDLIVQEKPRGNFGTELPIDPIRDADSDCYYRYRFMFIKMRYECKTY